jgi:hypothetical protein
MGFLNRLERALGRYAIPNLSLYLIGGQVLFFGFSMLARFDVTRIMLLPALVLEGEFWRLFSFVLVPPVYGQLTMTQALFLAISWYFFYMISQALENYWGAFRFNIFFLVGWVLTVGVSFLAPNYPTGYEFFAVSVFLAFALLNPDFELYLFFILPVKIKWFALLMWLSFGYYFVTGGWGERLAILAATGNYFLFLGGEVIQRMKSGRHHMQQQVRRSAMKDVPSEPRHTCVVCGKNDRTHPREDFRYADDDKCYCSEHRPGAANKA